MKTYYYNRLWSNEASKQQHVKGIRKKNSTFYWQTEPFPALREQFQAYTEGKNLKLGSVKISYPNRDAVQQKLYHKTTVHLNDACLQIIIAQITNLDFTYGKTYRKHLD